MKLKTKSGPVLFDLDNTDNVTPSTAPPVPELDIILTPTAMQRVASLAAKRPNRLVRWFWGLLFSLIGLLISVAAWDFVIGLLYRSPILGWVAVGLTGLFCGVLLLISLREMAAFGQLRRVNRIQTGAAEALINHNLTRALEVTGQITALYQSRDDTRWGREVFADKRSDMFDADALLGLAENTILAPLDARARLEVEAAARQVATITAIVPLALADVLTALTANMRMIRRIAEIYEGRSGTLGTWRLARQVLSHLVTTGAIAVGDDLIGSVVGGGLLSKVSRRFGEGVINGALTARVGVAAMEVCRPLAFAAERKPLVTSLVKQSLKGLFGNILKDH
ncbi:MAG: TIGR01620 family protein [Octadecabacter sp.]|nr:TIGR01620 family protein [Octadecabacter sp.]